jgi:Fe-S cluster assembly protein SufD
MPSHAALQALEVALEKKKSQLQGRYSWEVLQQKAGTHLQTIGGLPTQQSEDYKYSPISAFLAEQFDLGQLPLHGNILLPPKAIKQPIIPSYPFVLTNGMLHSAPQAASLCQVESLIAAYSQHKSLLDEHFQKYFLHYQDPFSVLNTALFSHGTFIYIPDHTILDKPLWLCHITESSTQPGISYPRVLIWVGQHSRVSIITSWQVVGEEPNFTNAVTEIVVGKGAQVDYYNLQLAEAITCQVNTTYGYQAEHSILNAHTITCKGLLVRNNLHLALQEPYATANLYGLYWLEGSRQVDNQTKIDHQAPATKSHEVYKGILKDKTKGVFNGKIYVQRKAQHTHAFQRNNNVLLSPEATIHTKPQLEIWADDVKCTHGATVGQLEPEQMFYLQARGISQKIAQRILLHAFCAEIMTPINPPALQQYIREKLPSGL